MARIRSIKPAFFRHEGLQDLEASNPGKYPMLVFAGLWTACDRFGRFEWKPRTLKLDILPFLPFDMVDTLELLERAGQVTRYTVGGKEYGLIKSFGEHQRITGKEATAPAMYPAPEGEQPGIAGEATEKQLGAQEQEGKEEQEGNGERDQADSPPSTATAAGAVCVLLKSKGIPDVAPGNLHLKALLDLGIDIGAFSAAADVARERGNCRFAYVLGIVKRQAEDAKKLAESGLKAPPAKRFTPPHAQSAMTVINTEAERTKEELQKLDQHAAEAVPPPAHIRERLGAIKREIGAKA